MPALKCKCETKISYGEIPCDNEWLFISDVDYAGFSDMVDAEAVYRAMNSFLKCPACGRLWVFWDGFGSPPQEFVPAPNAG